ncbi:ATP-binding protein, partial [Streptomyces anthocyanicus]
MTAHAPLTSDPLLLRLARLRDRVGELVDERTAGDPTAGDPLRGLYLSDEAVRHLLAPTTASYPSAFEDGPDDRDGAAYEGGGPDRLELLAVRLGLTELDLRILLIALAPDLERSFESLYGYLNDDVSRRRATTGLALDLCGLPVHFAGARARFHPSAPLTALGLLNVEDPERPFLSRALRVPDRLIAH